MNVPAADVDRYVVLDGSGANEAGRSLTVQHADGPALASARLHPRIGLAQPRYWYHVGLVVHSAATLDMLRPQRTLLLGNDLTGAAELCDITWSDVAALQALIAAAQRRVSADATGHSARLIVELPGMRDATGTLPFWHGLGRHFYSGDLEQTAARAGPGWRSHLATLLPRHLIYASFLPDAANAAIGAHAADAQALRDALEAQGMQWRQHIGIVDGGAVMEWTAGALPPTRAHKK